MVRFGCQYIKFYILFTYLLINSYCVDEHEQLTAENTDDSNHDGDKMGAPLREQDRFLPIANVAKIMKRAIPETGKVNSKVRIASLAFHNFNFVQNIH